MSLTCLSCKLLFSVPELHQEHYKSDWHRYNLKRRLAELPPLTKEDFDRRAAAFKEDVEGQVKKVSSSCEICNKHFSTKNAMVSHLQSKKHKTLASQPKKTVPPKKVSKLVTDEVHKPVAAGTPMDVEIDDDDEEWSDEGGDGDWESCDDSEDEDGIKRVVVDTNDCLFCDQQSDSTEGNVAHMSEVHSFFIPDVEYLTDLDGLIGCLAGKIHLDRICLWCHGKGKGFRSVKSVQRHMLDKGHCKMLHEGEALADYEEFYDFSSIDLEKEIGDVNVIDELLEGKDEDMYLALPSGATIGHRSIAYLFKQNMERSSNNQLKLKKVLNCYKSLGYAGTTGPALVKKARDLSYMKRIRDRYNLKLGVKQNKFQPHFRPQVMF